VNNVDETIAQATQLGGKVCMPPMEVPGVGRMAVISDPQGATFSVITYSF
jgi:predicted enzyme related to lactoylglutathione lyase